MSEIGMIQCFEVKEQGLSQLTSVLPLLALMALQMLVLKKGEAGTPLFLLQCETRAKEQSKT